jgi:hypothetical protein
MPTSVPSPARKVLVCFAPNETPDWFSTAEKVDDHLQVNGTPVMRYQVRRPRWWQFNLRNRLNSLVNVRPHGGTSWCSGGQIGLLDLTATAAVAVADATARYREWKRTIERTTDKARPWSDFLAQHQKDPKKVSWDEARRRFEEQPRVIAMLAYTGAYEFDPYELDLYQASEETYVSVFWQSALVGEALITAEGKLLEPTSPSTADRTRYLRQACAYMRGLSPDHGVCMVTLS